MSNPRPFQSDWTNSQRAPSTFPAVSAPSPRTFPINPISSQPQNADIILGWGTPRRWISTMPFDSLQANKELIFVSPWHIGDHPDQPQCMSLGQVNLVMRESWRRFTAMADKQPARVTQEDQDAKMLADEYASRGEDMFYDSERNTAEHSSWLNGSELYNDERKKFLLHLCHVTIMENYRLVGVKKTATSMVSGIVGDLSCASVLNGRGIVVNYWGKDAQIGQNLFLVLKQSKDDSGNVGPFQFVPWAGLGSPPQAFREYEDYVGRKWKGCVYKVGAITRGNHIEISDVRTRTALGIQPMTTAEQINKEAVGAPSLDINVMIGDDM